MIKLAKKKSKSDWIKIDEVELLVDYPTNEQEVRLQEVMVDSSLDKEVRNLRYARLFLKFVIKDWKGIDEECKLYNNELDNELWLALTSDIPQTLTIFGKLFEELSFTEVDKKKS